MTTTAAPHWKVHFLNSISQSNFECRGYSSLINDYQRLIEVSAQQAKHVIALNKQVVELKDQNMSLVSEVTQLKESGSAEARKKLEDMELRVRTQQEELTSVYKTKYEKTEEVLALKQNEKRLENDLKAAREEIAEMLRKLEDKSRNLQELEHSLSEITAAMSLVQREHLAERDEKQKAVTELTLVKQQLAVLETRWLQKVKEDADRMNDMLEQEDRKMKARRAEELVKRAETNFPTVIDYGMSDVSLVPQQLKFVIDAHSSEGNDVCFGVSGLCLASASTDKDVKIWDSKGSHQLTLSGQSQAVMSVHFSTQEDLVLGASNDSTVRVWRAKTGQLVHALAGHTNKIFAARFYFDQQHVVSGSCDRTIKYWDLLRGYCTRTTLCGSSCNSVSPDSTGQLVASGHFDKTVRIWDVRDGKEVMKLEEMHSQQVSHVEYSADSTYILSCSRDGVLKVTDSRTYEVVSSLVDRNLQIPLNWSKPCFSPDARYVAAGGHDGRIFIFDVLNGSTVHVLSGAHGEAHVAACAWSAVSSALASIDKNGKIAIWGPK